MSEPRQPWEPDPRKMGNWQSMFEPKPRGEVPASTQPVEPEATYEDAAIGSGVEYKPWTLQRGRSRPAMMMEFRRFEPRSGLWSCWALAYPNLLALEYTGDRILSLDFGIRQIVMEGRGLDQLARHIEDGTVVAVHEFSSGLWADVPTEPIVVAIRNLTAA